MRFVALALMLSIGAAAVLVVLGLSRGSFDMAIMFGFLAYNSYQILQSYSGRGGGNPW